MRKLLLLLIVLSSIAASSQQWSLPVSNHQRIAGLWAERRLKLPADTAFTKEAGCVTLINGVLYVADGTKWNTYASGGGSSAGVSSFDGRFGAVVPQTGDYTINMITGGLDSIRRRVDSIWVSGGSIFVRKGSNQNSFPISVDWASGYPTYDTRYPSITRFLDTSANIWSRVQSTYQVAQANYSTTYSLSNDIRDSLSARYTKAQSDARFLQSFTEGDPVWTAAAANYYTKTQADARYLQSFTETDPTVYAWAKAATKPAYAVAEITGLQTALDGKEPVLGFTPVPNTRTINGYALSANISLTKTDVGLGNVPNTDATNPANISQSASYRFVTDTEKSTWNAKQNALGFTPENAANKGVPNGYAALGSDSKILAYQLPQVAINQTFTVNSQSAMLALSANQGDIAVRTDQNKAYILAFTGASTLANWIALPGVSNEADPVYTASVAYGITGTNVSNWNTAFGWGNHAGLYRPVSWVPAWTDVTGRPTALSAFTNDPGFITATTNALTNYYTITQSDARFAQLTGSEFTGNLTLPNGVFYRARRSTSNAVINVLGFDSGTDNLSMMISNDLLIRNTGAVTVMSLTNGGNLATLGTITGTGITGTTGSFTNSVNANFYSVGGVPIVGWGGTVAQFAPNSYWQSIELITNGVVRQTVSNTAATFSVPISGTSGTFTAGVDISNGAYLQLAGTFTRLVRSGGLQIENNGFQWLFNDAGNFVAPGSISSWGATFQRPIYVATGNGGYAVSVGGSGGDYGSVGYNVNYTTTTSSYNYRVGDFASFIRFQSGGFQFFTAPSGSANATMTPTLRYTLDVNGNNTWTGSGSFGGSFQVNSSNILLGSDGTYGGTYNALGFGGLSNGSNRIFAAANGADGIYIASATGRAIYFRAGGGTTDHVSIQSNGLITTTGSITIQSNTGLIVGANGRTIVRQTAGGDAEIGAATGGDLYLLNRGSTALSFNSVSEGFLVNHLTVPNGVFFRARRSTSSAILNVLGFESGTDNLAMTISDNLFIKNTGASTIYTLTWQGAATYAGGITAPTGNFTSTTASTSGTTGAVVIAGGLGVGGAIHASGGFFNSDKRWKNIEQRISASSGIDAVKWTWNASHQVDYREHWGYVAQEVLKVLPEAVSMSAEGFYSVEYNSVFSYKIAMLEKRVADLEKKATLTDWLTEKVLQLQLQVINLQFPQKSNRK